MIRITNPWGVGNWTSKRHLHAMQEVCDTMNRTYGKGTYMVQHASLLERLKLFLTNHEGSNAITMAGQPQGYTHSHPVQLYVEHRDRAIEAMSAISHPSMLLDTMSAHIEARPDMSHFTLMRFANRMARLADKLERERR